jgi:hypothetical protein
MNKLSLLIFLCLFFGVISCDNTLNPVDTENGIFAVYGALDLRSDTNYIRVNDLNQPFTEDATRNIDAEVVLENLDSGFREVLEDQRVLFQGVYQHNFKAAQPITPNTEYRITVTRSDGAVLSLNTTSPSQPEAVAEPINQNCYTPIEVTFDPMYKGTIAFYVEYRAILPRETRTDTIRQGIYTFRNEGEPGTEAVYTFTPVDIMKLTPQTGGTYRCTDLIVPEFNIVYRHFSEGFYEKFYEGKFEAFESTQRFGSYYADTLTIPVDDSRVCPPDCLTNQSGEEGDE